MWALLAPRGAKQSGDSAPAAILGSLVPLYQPTIVPLSEAPEMPTSPRRGTYSLQAGTWAVMETDGGAFPHPSAAASSLQGVPPREGQVLAGTGVRHALPL